MTPSIMILRLNLDLPGLPLDKDDGEFGKARSLPVEIKLHFHEEGITIGSHPVEIDPAKRVGLVADEAAVIS